MVPGAVAAASAFNPFSTFAAVEIRLYAMALLLSAAIVTCFFAAFVDLGGQAPRPHHFSVVAVTAVYAQYFSAALLVGGFFALLFLRRWRTMRGCTGQARPFASSCGAS